MKKSFLIRRKTGFTLVEILVSLGIFSFVATGVLSFSAWIIQSVQTEASKADRNVENLEMLKLFTQPLYFGALSKHQENSQLKACMTTDTVFCDSSKEYSVTPFDLATNQILESASSSKDSSIKNQIRFKVHCPNNETSCDKADYFTVIVKTFLDYHGFHFSSIEKKGVVTPEFNNVVTYVPDAVLAPGRPINVILFLDNSNSMAFAKDQVKEALDSLIAKISTMDATLSVYPLVPIYSTKQFHFTYDALGNQVPLTVQSWQLPPGTTYYYTSTYIPYYFSLYPNQDPSSPVVDPYFSIRTFNFLSTDPAEVRTKKMNSVKGLVDYMFSYPATSSDTPICNMIRLIEAPGENSPFKFDPMTPTALLIVSNEDDESTGDFFSLTGCKKNSLTQMTVNPTQYWYFGSLHAFDLSVEANASLDGASYLAKINFDFEVPYDASRIMNTDCLAEANAIPYEKVEDAFIEWKNRYYSNSGWTYEKGKGITIKACKTKTVRWIISAAQTSPKDYCSRIAAGTYEAPPSYIPDSCHEEAGSGSASGHTIEKTSFFSETASPVDALYSTLKNQLGLENFYYTAIVHPDLTTCTLTAGSQVGTRYIALAKKPGMKSTVIPVCASDYTTQLDKIVQWTESLGANDIQLTPSVAANMNGVEIVRSGTVMKLTANVDYQLSGTVLIFKTGLLQSNDIIKVYLK